VWGEYVHAYEYARPALERLALLASEIAASYRTGEYVWGSPEAKERPAALHYEMGLLVGSCRTALSMFFLPA